jgi:2-polyprenyl-3-methyl-5-hydroxy-6-metoxy-1,4-benzoquinol methylase
MWIFTRPTIEGSQPGASRTWLGPQPRRDSTDETSVDAIERFYHQHPYPQVDQVEVDRNLVDHLRYLAHRCGANPAPRTSNESGRLLVAGCGTREAVMWALCAPQYEVHAVDLSADSLAIAEHLATQLGVADRIRFTQGRLDRGDGMEGPYDFISSFGVLHHLPDPERGFAQLASVLAPEGVMAVMVYSHTNRRPIQEAQRIIGLMSAGSPPAAESVEDAESVAVELCRTGAHQTHRLQEIFRKGLGYHASDRPHFADTLLNPREVSYSVPELSALLERHGLGLLGPVVPPAWRPLHLIPPSLHERFLALPMLERMEIADLLVSPLLWVLAGHPSSVRRACDGDGDLFWDRVPLPLDAATWPVHRLRVADQPVPVRIVAESWGEDRVKLHRNPLYPGLFHRIARRMADGVDGRRTLRELARAAATAEGTTLDLVAPTLADYWRTMIDDLGLFTPDVSRCSGCPQRKAASRR